MEYARILDLDNLLKQKSFFLFGPRSTGKSFLIRKQLADKSVIINLLDGETYLRYSAEPSLIHKTAEMAVKENKIVVIDEIQKIPMLLDQAHLAIEEMRAKFLLTGSSARKLKRGGVNLLAGRAWEARMFPLVWPEIPDFDLERYLRYGGLPQVYSSPAPEEELSAYVNTYLKEEIAEEGVIRKMPQFARFLKVAALCSGEIINYSAISSDCAVAASTVREYFSILEHTLTGFTVEPWTESKKRKAITTAKFYMFDTGVAHILSGTEHLERNSNLFGKSFEQWIAMELRAYLSYRRAQTPLCYWRSVNGQEVDFVIGNKCAIEVKSAKKIGAKDLRGLNALAEEKSHTSYICISHDPVERREGIVWCMPWQIFMKRLWSDGIAV
ncbi:MAG: ATP-binding protein [Acidobacteriota bacterium]|jgi:predicted AAA+ superfamily ATPase|nr:ATP-binding protein [Acidobacteriota bacterium]